MNEFFASQRLSAYIDGELSAAEMAEVERALRENPELRAEYERLQATVDFLREHGPVRAPMGFHDKVMAAVEDEPMPGGLLAKIRGWFSSMPVETFAVALAAVLVAVIVGQRLDDAPETAPSSGEQVDQGDRLADRSAKKTEATQAAPVLQNADGDLGSETTQAKSGSSKDAPAWAEEMAGVIMTEDEQPQKRVSSITEPASEDAVVMLEVDEAEPPETSPKSKDMPDTEIEDGSTTQQVTSAASYRLQVSDPGDLVSLLMLVETYGGVAVGRDGRPLSEDALRDGSSTVGVSVHIPASNVTAFYKGLSQVGQVQRTSENAAQPLSGPDGTVKLYLDVTQ